MEAKIEVIGIVLTISGKVHQHSLIDMSTNKSDRAHLQADFDTKRLFHRRIKFKHFFTERKLKEWIGKRGIVQLITRIPLPRLQYMNQFYYPLSERVANVVIGRLKAYEDGHLTSPLLFVFHELEGSELQAAWDPIWEGHYRLWGQAAQE